MKQFLLCVFIFINVVGLKAQNSILDGAHYCSQSKINMYKRMAKHKRASNYANYLMNKYNVTWYYLQLNAERDTTYVQGITTIKSLANSPIDTFCFELNRNLIIDSIKYNNFILPYSRDTNSITYASLPFVINSNATFSIQVYYHGDAHIPASSAIGGGYSTGYSARWNSKVTWSLSEPYAASDWFACKQFLADKADSSTVEVITSEENKVGSNGNLISTQILGNNKVKIKWHSNYPIDYYLISVAIAKYTDYTFYAHLDALPNDSIKIVNYIYNDTNAVNYYKPYLDTLPLLLNHYSNLTIPYPFYKEKYGHCLAEFGGGMEHQTMTTLLTLDNIGLNTHELFHSWFGDYVTCATWHDIALNEGITSYGEILTIEKLSPPAQLVYKLTTMNENITSEPTGSVYNPDTTDIGRIFNGRLTYRKGSMVMHTMRFIMGDTLFFKTLRNYLTTYANSTATTANLKTIAEQTSGLNLNDYFNEWFYGEGYPTWGGEFYSDGKHLVLKINHHGSVPNNNLYKMPLEIKLLNSTGDSTMRVNINSNSDTIVMLYNKVVSEIQIDPNIKMARKIDGMLFNANLATVLNDPKYNVPLSVQIKNNMIHFFNNTTNAQVTMYSTSGSIINIYNLLPGENTFDINHLAKGIYLLKTKDNVYKVVK